MRSILNSLLAASLFITPFLAVASAHAQQQTGSVPSGAAASIWWKHAVLYEIYPRSFQDSNGDGIGDLNGISSRLDYLEHLGVDAIWIAPMYPSPQVDFGYDISDYQAVDPQYGTLADMDRLIARAKTHHIRVVLDMVLNHTSDKHRWFQESAASRTNPKADWYVWNDGVPAGAPGVTAYQKRFEHDGRVPPNNWVSYFGGSSWEWVSARKQFYYHKFYRQQPDLNWRKPAVEKAAFDAMRFWLDRGVAGFRLDAIPTLFEDPELRDDPETGGLNAQGDPNVHDIHTSGLPEVHDVLRRMRAMVSSYPGDRVLIGETYLPNTAELDRWYGGSARNELQLPMDMLIGFSDKLSAPALRQYLREAGTELHGSEPLFVFDNHDNVRSVDRYTPPGATPEERARIGKLLASVLLTTPATALLYQGEELGMMTSTPARREDVKDPVGITGWPKEKGRDGERTPMQWSDGPQSGFSTDPHTWLPVAKDYRTVNVVVESRDPNSQLNWYQHLIDMRRTLEALREGGLTMLDPDNPDVLSFIRTGPSGGKSVIVSLNLSGGSRTVSLDLGSTGAFGKTAKTLLTDTPALEGTQTLSRIVLPGYASWIGSLE